MTTAAIAQVEHQAMDSKTGLDTSSRVLFVIAAALFGVSTTATVGWCASMASMPGMPMPGGWTMSMPWMRMPGQTWLGAAASFLAMWVVMMFAMMLPSLSPTLWRCQRAVGGNGALRGGLLASLVAAGYFAVWTLVGVLAFPLGAALATIEMREPIVSNAVPMAVGVIVTVAGAFQFTSRKADHLACCRQARRYVVLGHADGAAAWRNGVALGLDCARCCANLMAILFVAGVMNPWPMALITVAITAERLAPAGQRVARSIGIAAVAWGIYLVADAVAMA